MAQRTVAIRCGIQDLELNFRHWARRVTSSSRRSQSPRQVSKMRQVCSLLAQLFAPSLYLPSRKPRGARAKQCSYPGSRLVNNCEDVIPGLRNAATPRCSPGNASGWRNTVLLVRPMLAARPAARAAFSFEEISANSLDLTISRFLLFRGQDPTNPFVACQRREAGPRRQDLRVGGENCPQIVWDLVDDARWNGFPHMSRAQTPFYRAQHRSGEDRAANPTTPLPPLRLRRGRARPNHARLQGPPCSPCRLP